MKRIEIQQLMCRIVIIDDHKMLIEGLQLILGQEDTLKVVGVGYNSKQAISILEDEVVDILLLDINLPDKDGIRLCKEISKSHPDVKIIALTTYDKGVFVRQMLQAGARGYILKSSAADEIVIAIKRVACGETYLSQSVSFALLESIRNDKENRDHFIPQLTRREQQVLQLIAAENTTSEIAHQLHLSQNTIETHRRNLLSKLNVRNVAGMIKVALKKGLID